MKVHFLSRRTIQSYENWIDALSDLVLHTLLVISIIGIGIFYFGGLITAFDVILFLLFAFMAAYVAEHF